MVRWVRKGRLSLFPFSVQKVVLTESQAGSPERRFRCLDGSSG